MKDNGRDTSWSRRMETALAFAIPFIGGYNPTLPNRGWATVVQVVHAVFLDNTLLILYLGALFLAPGRSLRVSRRTPVLEFATLVALLAALGLISVGAHPTRANDIGDPLRILLYAAYLIVAVHWSRNRDATFVLRAYLIGIAVGGALNIYYSVTDPYLVVGFLPALRSRNVAGGFLGMGVCLGAWLMIIGRERRDRVVAVVVSVVGLSASAMSFSKTAMTIAACGAIAWLLIIGRAWLRTPMRAVMLGAAAVLTSTVAVMTPAVRNSVYVESAGVAIGVKFTDLSLEDRGSTQERYQYLWGVLDIATAHPLVGVSYGGFYDAIVRTPTYKSGVMAEEDPDGRLDGTTNPHNTFLFYTSANGVPGLLVSLLIFAAFLWLIWRSLDGNGLAGRVVWAVVAVGYLVYGMTLPNMLATSVLFLPAAAALSLLLVRASAPAAEPNAVV
jgi:O-antigen ligase